MSISNPSPLHPLEENAAPGRSQAADALRVALVCMPFYEANRPSIQLGLLHAIAESAGFAAQSFHLNLDLASHLTPRIYDELCRHRRHMTGEWLFSVAAFGDQAPETEESFFSTFPDEVIWAERLGLSTERLMRLRREELPAFVEGCSCQVEWSQFDVVGFTSTFQQNVASLALARRIKERFPHIKIIFGGANMEDEMGPEYVRSFPYLDFAVVGEGDVVFPKLLQALQEGTDPEEIAGVVARVNGEVRQRGQAAPIRDLDALPTPEYGDYYERARTLGLLENPEYSWAIPVESSRGCWWGAKRHCTFCGLNGLGMAFRSKTPDRFMREITDLAKRYRITFFQTTDNILDMGYLKSFFPRVDEARLDYEFFFETKANLTREQLAALRRGGVRWLQPGIESLSTHILTLMRKGTTMLQNVRLLKWCRYYGIRVSWNLIWGFPGETPDDYRGELDVLKRITHLQPPDGCGPIWLERFSPYFTNQEGFPVRERRPEASYAFVYPALVDLDKAAYFFDYTMDDTLPREAHRDTGEWVKEWRRRWGSKSPDSLLYRRTADSLFIDDARENEKRGSYTFHGPIAFLYEYCSDTSRTPSQSFEHVERVLPKEPISESDVQSVLDHFCQLGLALEEDGRYLSLALPFNPNW